MQYGGQARAVSDTQGDLLHSRRPGFASGRA
jgi:hypothetical protein